ncbi:hypothetical protein ABPG74_002965 [Tetrahymena malaccensis]
MTDYKSALEATEFIKSKINNLNPQIGIVLGSGLGNFGEEIQDKIEISYGDIPHFKKTQVVGHAGKLIFGKIEGVDVVCMQGRYHFYEGHTIQECVFPIKVFKLLNIKILILTNAAGGLNDSYESGDLILIRDHINMLGINPLIGLNEEEFGPRFPDMSITYTPQLLEKAKKVMKDLNISIKTGTYAGLRGPNYETPAEVQMLRMFRADLVGASTVYEAIVASHMNIQVLGISCVSNMGAGISKTPLSHQEIIDVSNSIKSKFSNLIKSLIPNLL